MIMFKTESMKPEYANDLPFGSVCRMTDKESITTKRFIHCYTILEDTNLQFIFDGAQYHFEYEIVEMADGYKMMTMQYIGLSNIVGTNNWFILAKLWWKDINETAFWESLHFSMRLLTEPQGQLRATSIPTTLPSERIPPRPETLGLSTRKRVQSAYETELVEEALINSDGDDGWRW